MTVAALAAAGQGEGKDGEEEVSEALIEELENRVAGAEVGW